MARAPLPDEANDQTSSLMPRPDGQQITLAKQAQEHYSRAMQAQRQGDWAEYGQEIERLGDILTELEESE